MKIFGIAGWSGSGKTTLITSLLPNLTARGISVSTVKHAHLGFDIDKPGKDSFVHRMSGNATLLSTDPRSFHHGYLLALMAVACRWAAPLLVCPPPSTAVPLLFLTREPSSSTTRYLPLRKATLAGMNQTIPLHRLLQPQGQP